MTSRICRCSIWRPAAFSYGQQDLTFSALRLPVYAGQLSFNQMPSSAREVVVDAFNAAHPGITLELIGPESISETLRVAIQAGAAPDILQTPGANFISEFVEAGLVLPLDETAAELGWQDKLLN